MSPQTPDSKFQSIIRSDYRYRFFLLESISICGGRAHSPAPKEANENTALPEKENRKSVEEEKRQRAEILTLIGWLVIGALILWYIHNDWQRMQRAQENKKARQAAQELQETNE